MSSKGMVSAAYDTFEGAAAAVRELEAAGIGHEQLAIVTKRPHTHGGEHLDVAEHSATLVHEEEVEAGRGLASGVVGGVAGGLLVTLGAAAIPGVGPFLAAGWIANVLAGACIGSASGLAAALVECGHFDRHAKEYVQAVEAGSTLVVVRVQEGQFSTVEAILNAGKSEALPLELVG